MGCGGSKESILERAEKAEFWGATNGVGWQGAVRSPDPGVGVNILLD